MHTKLLLSFTICSIEMYQWHTGDDHFAILPISAGNSVNIRWRAKEVREFVEFLRRAPSGSIRSVSDATSVQKLSTDDTDKASVVLLHFFDDQYQSRGVKLVMTPAERLELEKEMIDMIEGIGF